jgi:WD40 repeat protein
VAQELGLVVTVALDKAVRYWSLEQGIVLETVFDAHDAPITCCALTSPATCDLRVYEMLLATGGSDNVVKVWRRNEPQRAECVFRLAGHNDAIRSVAFDPNGVFLVSSSEDTTAITWRVRPSSPDQPEAPLVVLVDRFSIHVSWTEPLANGAKILHYVVRTTQISSFTGDGSDLQVVPDVEVPAKYLSKAIEKLQPGVKYSLKIAAVNHVRVILGQANQVWQSVSSY